MRARRMGTGERGEVRYDVGPRPNQDDHIICQRCGAYVSKKDGEGTMCWDQVLGEEDG